MNTQRPTPRTDSIIEYLRVQFPATEGHIPLREKIGELERELAEAQAVVQACMSAMPVGNIQTHTPENLAARIGDLAAALAMETSENEAMRAAIQEAATAFQFITSNWTERDLKPSETIRQVFHAEKITEAKSALAALKPFLPETPCQPGE